MSKALRCTEEQKVYRSRAEIEEAWFPSQEMVTNTPETNWKPLSLPMVGKLRQVFRAVHLPIKEDQANQ